MSQLFLPQSFISEGFLFKYSPPASVPQPMVFLQHLARPVPSSPHSLLILSVRRLERQSFCGVRNPSSASKLGDLSLTTLVRQSSSHVVLPFAHNLCRLTPCLLQSSFYSFRRSKAVTPISPSRRRSAYVEKQGTQPKGKGQWSVESGLATGVALRTAHVSPLQFGQAREG